MLFRSGLPVVSRDVGDVRQRLSGVHPSRVTGDSPEELGRALGEVLRDNVRSNGPDVVHDFSIDSVAARILAIYRAAAAPPVSGGGGRQPAPNHGSPLGADACR